MTRRTLSLCLALAMTLACGGKKESANADAAPMTSDELCALHGAGLNNPMSQCRAVSEPPSGFDSNATEDCKDGALGRQWADALLDSLNNKRISIDWAKARSCNSKARTLIAGATSPIALLTSDAWRALTQGDCAELLTANVDTGGTCVYQWDCKNPSDLCSTPPPYTSATFTCIAPGAIGDACDGTSSVCGAGAYCKGSPGTCAASPTPCTTDAQCGDNAIGICAAGVCVGRISVALGGACSVTAMCKDGCAHCQIAQGATAGTCALMGTAGAGCAHRSDCAIDQGCNPDGTCGVVAVGAACSRDDNGTSHAVCDTGLTCLPDVTCTALNQASCMAKAPSCEYTNGACRPDVGTCTLLPTSGACLPAVADSPCASHFTCVSSDGQCHANATSGEACSTDGSTAPKCDDGFGCSNGLCATYCDDDRPCAAGQYCSDANACKTVVTDSCVDGGDRDQCGATRYCASPSNLCPTSTTQATCTSSDCFWNGGKCVAAAGAVARCQDRRSPGSLAVGTCGVGGSDVGTSQSCDSGFCLDDGVNPATCIVAPRSCLSYGFADELLPVFAFGMVGRWRRTRRKR